MGRTAHEGEHDGQVPAAQALPGRAGSRSTTCRWTSGRRRRFRPTCSTCATSPLGSRSTGEFVDGQALSPEGTFVRYDGEGRPPVTDGPFAETKDLIAGWMVIDVETYERALELAGELSAAPGAGGKPIHEWLEVRPFLTEPADHHGVTHGGRGPAADPHPQRDRYPRPSRSRLRGGRGCRAGRPGRGRARRGRTTRRGTPRAGWSPWPGASSSTPPAPTPPGGTARSASRSSPRPTRARRWTTRSSCTSCARTRP